MDLVRLGALHLATRDLPGALRLTEAGLERREDDTQPPRMALNVYLAAGRLAQARKVAAATIGQWKIDMADPGGGGSLRYGVEPEIAELQVYGALGYTGPSYRETLARMERKWDGMAYDARQRAALRQSIAKSVGPALAWDPDVLRTWTAGWEDVPPVWRGFLAAPADGRAAERARAGGPETDEAGRWLDRALVGTDPAVPGAAQRAFLLGLLAQRAGRHETSTSLLARLDSLPLRVDDFAVDWGLRSLSHLLRARSYRALERVAPARESYATFLELWGESDPELEPLVAEARRALAGAN